MINIHQSKAQDFPLITDPVRMFWPSQPMAKPAYLESIKDPDFDVEIIRITGDPGDSIPGIGVHGKILQGMIIQKSLYGIQMNLLCTLKNAF